MVLSLKHGDTYKSSGNTILGALDNIGDPTTLKIKTFGTFIVKVGYKEAELTMKPIQIKRLMSRFAGSFSRNIFEKRIEMLLK